MKTVRLDYGSISRSGPSRHVRPAVQGKRGGMGMPDEFVTEAPVAPLPKWPTEGEEQRVCLQLLAHSEERREPVQLERNHSMP